MFEIVKKDVGWKVITDEQTYYVGEYCHVEGNDGVIFKDSDAFESGRGVCYVPEYDFENSDENMGKLFEFTVKEGVATEVVGNPYVTTVGYTRADFIRMCNEEGWNVSAEDLFNMCSWQHPETLLEELERE